MRADESISGNHVSQLQDSWFVILQSCQGLSDIVRVNDQISRSYLIPPEMHLTTTGSTGRDALTHGARDA